jgi:predicted nucleic acid-binding protein
MEVVLDSNVLFRTLISGGDIIFLFLNRSLKIYAPEKLKEELNNHKKEICEKSDFSDSEFNELLEIIFKVIVFVSENEYNSYFEKAKKFLDRHIKDIDFVALALSKNIKIWTYEKLLFDINMGISTKEIKEAI